MLRSTRLVSLAVSRTPTVSRFICTSPLLRKSPNEGMGEKKPVDSVNPLEARGEGVKNAAKSVLEGAQGLAQKATGTHEGNPNAKHPGPSPKTVRQEEIDRGLKEGLAKKGEEQGGL
ncbi:hypothetical protein JCM5353_004082 [Sporobolomyces roseus]